MSIYFVHLLNDNSGSPVVLNNLIESLSSKNKRKFLITSLNNKGILNENNANKYFFNYFIHESKIFQFYQYILAQFYIFFILCKLMPSKNSIIYVNTLLPFAAGLWGLLFKRKVVYHLHEVSITPKIFNKFLITCCRCFSSFNIFVSRYHSQEIGIPSVRSCVLYNSIPRKIYYSNHSKEKKSYFNVLMLASNRSYKGVDIFIKIVEKLQSNINIRFTLVLNETFVNYNKFVSNNLNLKNLKIFPSTHSVNKFYSEASLVLNLSKVDKWVETFGMTIIEGMHFSLPAIVPPVGGPVEIVCNGVNGYLINSYNVDTIIEKILYLSSNEQAYNIIAKNAKFTSFKFTPKTYAKNINSLLKFLNEN
jgi:glycosyltransferase involved in cell wall biosynthesis